MTTKISPAVLDVLKRCRIDEPSKLLYLPTEGGRLDRKLYTDTNKVLEALGGEWKRKLGGHLFDVEEVTPLLAAVIETGIYVDSKKLFQFFETPEPLADALVASIPAATLRALAGSGAGPSFLRVLDPSAGNGALLDALHRLLTRLDIRHDVSLWDAIEPQETCRKVLDSKGYNVLPDRDFLEYTGPIELRGRHQIVLMNPPFTKGQATAHFSHALELDLADVYAVIQPASYRFSSRKADEALRKDVAELAGEVTDNPEDAFKASGTGVRTVSIIIDRVAAPRGAR